VRAVFLLMDHQITAITPQKRNPNRVNIFLDGDYAFSLASIVATWLKTNQVVDDCKIEQLQRADSEEKAFQRALNFISYRPRSEAELKARLEKAGFSAEVVELTRDRLNASGLLGDQDFSRMWVENRIHAHPRSQRMLAFELQRKGVDQSHIDEALLSVPDDGELALAAGRNYARRLEGATLEEFRKRLMGFLARKGFRYDVILQVTQAIWAEININNGAVMGEKSNG
jgi:regulatory protein